MTADGGGVRSARQSCCAAAPLCRRGVSAPGAPSLSKARSRMSLRNIAIIAHVDHGKPPSSTSRSASRALMTTSVKNVRWTGTTGKGTGITILAKCTASNGVRAPTRRASTSSIPRATPISAANERIPLHGRRRHPARRRRRPDAVTVRDRQGARAGLKPIVAVNKIDRSGARRRSARRSVRTVPDARGQ